MQLHIASLKFTTVFCYSVAVDSSTMWSLLCSTTTRFIVLLFVPHKVYDVSYS